MDVIKAVINAYETKTAKDIEKAIEAIDRRLSEIRREEIGLYIVKETQNDQPSYLR